MNTGPRNETPQALGFHMPAEWHDHEATWISWPTNEVTWPHRLESVQKAFLKIIKILTHEEKVHLLVDDLETEKWLREEFYKMEVPPYSIRFFRIPTVDGWIRDYGPNFLCGPEGEIAFNDWKFNAWGNKYDDLKRDNRIPRELAPKLKFRRFEPGIVMEGGSIDVNGAGLCITTHQCLLNRSRNPELSKYEIENLLQEFLGIQRIIWLGEGIAGDDTDGHVDDIARFTSEDTIVCALEEDIENENYEPLLENFEYLSSISTEFNTPLKIVKLPMPDPVQVDAETLPASYANFYIANGVVLVPVFNQPKDKVALEILQSLFPTRKIIGIDCTDIVYGMGAIHCLTQQQPRGKA